MVPEALLKQPQEGDNDRIKKLLLGDVKQGLLYCGGTDQLVTQIIGVLAIAAWTSVLAIATFAIIKATIGLRVSEEEELSGLDILEHGTAGYGEGFGSWAPETTPVATDA